MGRGGVEKWRLKLTSAKVEVEVEAELGNCRTPVKMIFKSGGNGKICKKTSIF